MVELSRRFFLGGALSLLAVTTFEATVRNRSNMPIIYGDGIQDDSGGLNALFRNDPVIFDKDMIGVDSHKGIHFHRGFYRIHNTLDIPSGTNIKIDFVSFEEGDISRDFPFIRFSEEWEASEFKTNAAFITNHERVPYMEFLK